MKEISLPYHLIIPILFSVLMLVVIIFKRESLFKTGKLKLFWICLTLFFAFYLFILCGATYLDISNKITLQTFDLNRDGFFSGKEMTTEQSAAMRKVTSDTGRNILFITGLIFSGIIAGLVFGISRITQYIMSIKINSKSDYIRK